MSDLIRTDTIFGKRANIVGNISADLVLESLGKIYIKSRNSAKTLEEVIKSVALGDINETVSKTRIVEGLENIDTSSLKEGQFIFDKLSNILYLWIDGDFLELINVAPEGTGYVKRSGDTMTGRLTINVPNGPPLSVNSTELVQNLNVGYLQGESGKNFTRRNRDEKIIGSWQFKNPTKFESNALFAQDIIVNGSVGSTNFASGFGGYGWRMDADTNTLTVDNLVVRRLMQVYELVVNKISATNGSLWVTNAGKVVSAYKLPEFPSEFFSETSAFQTFRNQLYNGVCFIKYNALYQTQTLTSDAIQNASGSINTGKVCPQDSVLRSARVVIINDAASLGNTVFLDESDPGYTSYKLFDDNFRYNVNLPIVTRPKYLLYKDCLEYVNTEFESDSDEEDYIRALNTRHGTSYNSDGLIQIANNPRGMVTLMKPYFKYYSGGDYYLVQFDSDELPVFKPGDMLRCQKWTYGGIKYYDAVVCNQLGNTTQYIIQVADSILDYTTTITYNDALEATVITNSDNINMTLYEQSNKWSQPLQPITEILDDDSTVEVSVEEQIKRKLLGIVEEKDSLVQIGNLWDSQRQNAVYITSTDDGAPFIDTLSGINRPDYSVIYYIPIYKTVKLYRSARTSSDTVDVPYTGDYYIQDAQYHDIPEDCAEYVLVQNQQGRHFLKCTPGTPTETSGFQVLYWLTTTPNSKTLLGDVTKEYNLLLEDGNKILLEDSTQEESYFLLLEGQDKLLTVASTRTAKVRMGNLAGIQDEIFPIDKQPYGYGLYGQNVFLTGEFYLNNGQSLADISKDAITFAVASYSALGNSIYYLREETQLAHNLLEKSVYTKGDLFTAGMYIGVDPRNNKPGIVMWGNKILLATTKAELRGDVNPTALFENGRISAKFIQVYDIHSAWHTNTTPKKVTQALKTSDGIPYYTEVEVTQKLNNGLPVLDEDNNPVWQYTDELNNVHDVADSIVYDAYENYGWHLKALGDGYLAQGNIVWTKSGVIEYKGNVLLTNNNTLQIVKDNQKTFELGGISTTLNRWGIVRYAQKTSSSLTMQLSSRNIVHTQAYIDQEAEGWEEYSTIEFTANQNIVYTGSIVTQGITGNLDLAILTGYQYGSTRLTEFNSNINYITLPNVDYFLEYITLLVKPGTTLSSGTVSFQPQSGCNQIGDSFIHMESGIYNVDSQGKISSGNYSLLWFDNQQFINVYSTPSSHHGLKVDYNGVWVLKGDTPLDMTNLSDMTNYYNLLNLKQEIENIVQQGTIINTDNKSSNKVSIVLTSSTNSTIVLQFENSDFESQVSGDINIVIDNTNPPAVGTVFNIIRAPGFNSACYITSNSSNLIKTYIVPRDRSEGLEYYSSNNFSLESDPLGLCYLGNVAIDENATTYGHCLKILYNY